MAPKNKFTKEAMVDAALRVVRAQGIDGLTAKTMADELGTSTQPIFTAFGSMDGVKREVCAAAMRVYERYADAGLREKIPFFGVGMQHVRFAREEPELYRLLFLTKDSGAMAAMRRMYFSSYSRCSPAPKPMLPPMVSENRKLSCGT